MHIDNRIFYFFKLKSDANVESEKCLILRKKQIECKKSDCKQYVGAFSSQDVELLDVDDQIYETAKYMMECNSDKIYQIADKLNLITSYAHIFQHEQNFLITDIAINAIFEYLKLNKFSINQNKDEMSQFFQNCEIEYSYPKDVLFQNFKKFLIQSNDINVIEKNTIDQCIKFIYKNLELCKKYKFFDDESIIRNYIIPQLDISNYDGFAIDEYVVIVNVDKIFSKKIFYYNEI